MPSSYYSKLVRHRVASWTSLACAVRTPNGLINTTSPVALTHTTVHAFTRVLYTLCLGTVSVHAWVRPSYGLWGFARLQYTDYCVLSEYTVQESTGTMFRLKPTHRGYSCGD